MIPAEHEEVLGILDLVSQDHNGALKALLSTVHVVAQEEIIRFGREASILEKPEHVAELPMSIAYNPDWSRKFQQHGLLHEDIPRAKADHFNL